MKKARRTTNKAEKSKISKKLLLGFNLQNAEEIREKLIKEATPSELAAKLILERYSVEYEFQKIFPHFGYPDEGSFYVADFYLPKKKVCIEIDGDYHLTEKQKIKDWRRDRFFEYNGIQVKRFKNSELELLSAFLM